MLEKNAFLKLKIEARSFIFGSTHMFERASGTVKDNV